MPRAKPSRKDYFPPPPPVERLWNPDTEKVEAYCGGTWKGRDLRAVVKDCPRFKLPLGTFPFRVHSFDVEDLIEFARHMLHVQQANLEEPVIMDDRGVVIDGRHRMVKALLEGREWVWCVKVPHGSKPTIPPT